MKQLLIHVFQILMGVAAIFAAFQRGPILQRSGTAPFPNQRIRPNGIFRRRSRFDPWRDLESIRNATYWPMKL